MGLVFRKTRKLKKSWKSRKQTRRRNQVQSNKRKSQIGGYPTSVVATDTVKMIITYTNTNTKKDKTIKLESGQMQVDMTEQYNIGLLDKEPLLEITGLEPGKRYLLTMTDPNALNTTWTHWVAEIISNSNGAGQLVRPEIAKYAPPKPPKKSGVHHYIFRLYDNDITTSTDIPSPLKNMPRGDYFTNILKPIIEDKSVLAEATYTIDSSKIKRKTVYLVTLEM